VHKKRIKGKAYFYTSYRDETGKINTKYLGRNEKLAKKREAEFKGLSTKPWKPFLMVFLCIAGLLFIQNFEIVNLEKFLGLTGASMLEGDYEVSASPPSALGVGIYNATAYFNTSLFGYGNYSDSDFDDSNGTSVYKWFVNGVVNETSTTGQLLLCHFNNNYTCEEGETANVTQYHTEFNTSKETVNVTLTEENSSLVYINIPRISTVTEAFMNISGYLTSAYNMLKYDSIRNADYKKAGMYDSTGHFLAGMSSEGVGIDSWLLITNTTNLSAGQAANILSVRYGNATNTPSNGNFTYNLKICPTSLTSLSDISQTNDPDGNCTSDYVNIIDTVNLSSNFSDDLIGGWQNFTFNDNVSLAFDESSNYILKFEFVGGDLSVERYWKMYLVHWESSAPTYIAYNYSTYSCQAGAQYVQFYSKSRYPKGVVIDVGDDNTIDFADTNESFDTTNTTADFTSAISDYLNSDQCTEDYCDIPINVSSNSSGVIGLEALRISYDHYDLDGKFLQGMIANYTSITKYNATNNIHNHNGTLDLWVKPYWAGGDNNEYTFFTDSEDVIQLNKSAGNDLVFMVYTSTISCDISEWVEREQYLITATWNEGEEINLYTNGSNCAEAVVAPTTIPGLGSFIFIGSNAENKSQANATIDELRITGFPKSSDEISHYFSENRQFYQNEIFLNSTNTQIKRGDNITFELTPKSEEDAGTPVNSTPLNISNSPPVMPVLAQPANETYVSLPYSFAWNNATDYDKEDTVYYVLQMGDEDFDPVTHYNGSILEITSPTVGLVSDVNEGNYSWRVLSSDLTINSSYTEQRVVTIDSTAPNLTLIAPDYKVINVSSSDTEKEMIFYFNVSESNPLENCTLNLNGTASPTINQTLTHINQIDNSFTVTLAFGGYNWSINCTDIANNVNTTGKTRLVFIAYDDFAGQGSTTNLSQVDDLSNITNLTIEDQNYGMINYTGVDINLANGTNIDSHVLISYNRIEVQSDYVPQLNKSAQLTLYSLNYEATPYVQKDGQNCTDCYIISYSTGTGNLVFNVSSFSVYTAAGVPLPPPPTPTPTGGSGGGGGTKTLTKRKSFVLDEEKFVLQMKRGSQSFKKISLMNDGDLVLVFNIFHNLGDHLILSQEQFRLEPGEDKVVDANFYAGEPGLYAGQITVTADNIQKVIPVVLEVRSEKVVVDARLELLPEYMDLNQGDDLKAQITLFNTAKKNVPIVITYLIRDLEGNIVVEETETFDMLDEKSFVKTFDTSNLKAGSYVTGMNVRYLDSFSTSSARFDIRAELIEKPLFEFKLYQIITIVSLFILIMFLKLRRTNFGRVVQRKRRELKKYEK